MLVKICGNKSISDAINTASMGADFCGILVGQKYPSNDFVDRQTACAMVHELKKTNSGCIPVMVTHEVDPNWIADTTKKIGVSALQLHGGSTPEQVQLVKKLMPEDFIIITAVHVTTYNETLKNLLQYMKTPTNYYLLDTKDEALNKVGGTGRVHDWSVSSRIVSEFPKIKFILAGGLNPENVRSAISKIRPYGVDVNSGTKGKDNTKDICKIKKFIEQAKNSV
ncbi:MAG: hypothetical protein AB9861_16935 [Methanosarcina sp.]|jgi:phosphoribosylanthranilate isomerase